MKFNSKLFSFLLSYLVVVLGFFAFWARAEINLKQKTAELLEQNRVATKEPIGNFVAVAEKSKSQIADNQMNGAIERVLEPESVKGIYITAATASTSKFDKLLELIDKTELNAIVLDLKDWKQRPAFEMKREALRIFNIKDAVIRDLEALVKKAHEKGIYLIGRIAVFQDPYLVNKKPEWALHFKRGGIWKDWKGITWLDPTNREVWKYNVELAREAHERGFDEINFDYVRFPSDGPIEQIVYANYDGKTDKFFEMRRFFAYLDHELRRNAVTERDGVTQVLWGIPISVDLFGLTMGREDGLGIGQRLEDAAPFFNAVSPMVYPSHYSPTHLGFVNPAAHPYEVVYDAMKWGVAKLSELSSDKSRPLNSSGKPIAKLRPWLQDFDIGANYDAAMVRKQIQATYDAGLTSWFLWNASNNYTEDALEKDE